jgi:arsenite methyltransferase
MTVRLKGAGSDDSRRAQVRDRYGAIASRTDLATVPSGTSCCGEGSGSSCCGDSRASIPLGYTPDQLAGLPEGANLGLGCGNPTALLALRPGQSVLDLGCGAGIDCFLAAKQVGPRGSVLGVDMTPAMISRARENARKGGYTNVEFRLGEIEHLPVADRSVDVVISNCVVNLAPDQGAVYREAYRVLRPGGTLAVSDVVATRPIPEEEREDPVLWSACSSGALEVEPLASLLRQVGFVHVAVDLRRPGGAPPSLAGRASLGVVSADIRATKPRR